MTTPRAHPHPVIDSASLQRRLHELALISEAPAPVVTRILFSEADLRGRDYVRRAARSAGLAVREDPMTGLGVTTAEARTITSTITRSSSI